jgi:hypothetical protein
VFTFGGRFPSCRRFLAFLITAAAIKKAAEQSKTMNQITRTVGNFTGFSARAPPQPRSGPAFPGGGQSDFGPRLAASNEIRRATATLSWEGDPEPTYSDTEQTGEGWRAATD